MNIDPDKLKDLWNKLKELARNGITDAFNKLPGATPKEREDSAIAYVLEREEAGDHLLPVIGKFMDLPFVDLAQKFITPLIVRYAIRALVRREYDVMKIEKLLEEKA